MNGKPTRTGSLRLRSRIQQPCRIWNKWTNRVTMVCVICNILKVRSCNHIILYVFPYSFTGLLHIFIWVYCDSDWKQPPNLSRITRPAECDYILLQSLNCCLNCCSLLLSYNLHIYCCWKIVTICDCAFLLLQQTISEIW